MYIRTDKGIYYKNNEKIVEIYNAKMYLGKNEFNNTTYEKIITESGKIEELCDEFVYYSPKIQIKKYKYEYYHNLSEKEHDLKWLKEGKFIYGAIWTSKGLIYVAKMNEDGELELI